ncbi:FecCD family ABC transporter permease [Dendrosporobacter sp. 1207_IL3150]|uniref:FecCD family ABC transporter permease n=1 Tax=Dendrosporobacter sp. 1207_IL3150 TaxID=3084054 RepID=UPI002FD9D547
MSVLLGIVALVSLSIGQVTVPFIKIVGTIAAKLNAPGAAEVFLTPEQHSVFWYIRLPRVLVGILVGAALGISGAVMQGIFSNPLADPGIIGVSSGASLGAVIAIALGLTSQSFFYMPLLALAGSLLAIALIILLAMRDGKIPVMILLLAGIAVSMFMGAITSGILTLLNEQRLREFLFWMVGGLDYRRWEHVYLTVGPIIIGIFVLCLLARHINILVLGDQEARSVGVPVFFFRLLLLFITAVTTASAVCVSGTISFIGLVVPHIMRLLLGPDHRILLPASALAGSIFLVACDTVGRVLIQPTEIRVGIMTALVGAPYFLYLLHKLKQERGAA